MNNISSYEHLNKQELSELVRCGFTELGFYKLKKAYLKATGKECADIKNNGGQK